MGHTALHPLLDLHPIRFSRNMHRIPNAGPMAIRANVPGQPISSAPSGVT
ncbi:hypothetical protein [Roseibium sp.]